MVTLKPDGAIRWAHPVALKAAISGLSAGVRRLKRMAMSSAASGWGRACVMMVASVTRR